MGDKEWVVWIRWHQTGFGRAGLDWIGLDWIRLDLMGLGWVGLDWKGEREGGKEGIESDWIGSMGIGGCQASSSSNNGPPI